MKWLTRIFNGEEQRWSINCDYHNWTVHDLTTDQARAVLETLRDTHKTTVKIWRTGWASWKSLRDPVCADLMQTRIVKIDAPPLPHQEDFDPEITAVRPVSASSPFSTRKHTRFEVSYPVTVMSSNHQFATESVDLSEGGIQVRDPLPDWVAGYCTVMIEVEDGRQVEVLCSLAEDQKYEKKRLEIVASEKHSDFLEWFRRHPRFQP